MPAAGVESLYGNVASGGEVEDDFVAVGLDGVDVREQGGRAVVGVDVQYALDGELDVLGGHGGAVGELQPAAQLAAVALARGVREGAGLGRVGHRLTAAARRVHQRLDGLPQYVPGAGVVCVGRVEGCGRVLGGDELVRGAHDNGVTAAGPAVRRVAGDEHGREEADHSRQHQSLTVHLGRSPSSGAGVQRSLRETPPQPPVRSGAVGPGKQNDRSCVPGGVTTAWIHP